MTILSGKKGKKTKYINSSWNTWREKKIWPQTKANQKINICILDFHLGLKLENEAPKPVSSDTDTYSSLSGRVFMA